MKTKLIFSLVVAALCGTSSTSQADEVDLARVLGQNRSCDHVIRLIMRHGVNNSVNLNHAGNVLHHGGFGSIHIPASELGDLEFVQVTALPSVDGCGPKFAVVVRNQSSREVCGVRVTAVALLGRIRSHSPTETIKIEKICAGEALEVHVTLPIEALAMGNHNGQVIGFRRLLIAIDSYDQFVETNEANNIKVLDLASIPAATVTVAAGTTVNDAVSAAVQAVNASPATSVAKPSVATPSVATPTVTAPTVPATPQVPDDVQSAINKLNAQQTAGSAEQQTAASVL